MPNKLSSYASLLFKGNKRLNEFGHNVHAFYADKSSESAPLGSVVFGFGLGALVMSSHGALASGDALGASFFIACAVSLGGYVNYKGAKIRKSTGPEPK